MGGWERWGLCSITYHIRVVSPLQPGQPKTPRGSRVITKVTMIIKIMMIAIILANITRYYPLGALIYHFTTATGKDGLRWIMPTSLGVIS